MYVKVHKIKDSWFRDDNGALVGEDIFSSKLLVVLKHVYGNDKIFAKKDKNVIIIYYGYYDKRGIFNHFCPKTNCRVCKCDDATKNIFCPHQTKHHSSGYYIKTE